MAGPPTHLHNESLDLAGFNRACGVAVDSKGDLYVASAGESKVKVFNPAHTELAFVEDTHEPCGLAVNEKGELFVSEKATGKVVRYKPNAYPLSGTPTYGSAEAIDSSGNAKGISVDPHDGRLYVAEGNHIAVYKSDGSFEANLGEGNLTNATGVAAYTYVFSVTKSFSGTILEERATRYVFAADAASNRVVAFSGEVKDPTKGAIASPKFRQEISGPKTGESFGFGAAGALLALDPGNRNAEDKCASVAEQACTAGHLLVYDSAHNAVDEFEASGGFLDQFTSEALADAKPTAMAVDRSGGANDGTTYVTAGPGSGAKVLAFGPLAAPSREPLGEPLSHVLATAQAVATDSHGDVYVAAGAEIHVFGPAGGELTKFEDTHTQLEDLAVDSSGKVYVLENSQQVTYYTPSAYPPASGTTYARHEPAIATKAGFGGASLLAIAVNPGPSAGKDHVFVTSGPVTHEYDSAANGSTLLIAKFAEGLAVWRSLAVDGTSGNVYAGPSGQPIFLFDPTGKEVLARITGAGCPKGKFDANPHLAVDQSNAHVLEFQPGEAAREYDASGACVAEFGESTAISAFYRIAIDSACAIHEPPLTESTTPTCKEFDPANGNTYVAFDDPAPSTFDLTAFGPLTYGEAPKAETGVANGIGGGNATVNGTVNPRGFDLTECKFEYITDTQYISNGKTFAGASSKPCAESLAAIGKGTSPVAVHADLTGLNLEERWRFRLVAKNKYGESPGKAGLFGPPLITPKPALPVLYDEATLRAEVDPSGLATEYHFEYGKGAGEYDQSTPVGELPPGESAVAVQAALTGLAEGTTYHFRIVAENEASIMLGPDLSFTTLQRRPPEECANVEYRTGLSANLPDCRAYELITPAETNGLSPTAPDPGSPGAAFGNWLATPRGAGAGERLSYFTPGTLPGFDGNGSLDGYRASRGAGAHPAEGWTSQLFSPTYPETLASLENTVRQQGVAPDQEYSFWNLERSKGTLEKGVYLRAPAGFELLGQGSLAKDPKATSHFVSAGGAHAIFSSKAHLEPATPLAGDNTEAIYDRAAGASSATVVSVKPDGSPFGAGEDATYVASTEDGSAVLFKVGGVLYLGREGQSTEVAGAPSTFAGVSEDGKRVFYAATSSGEAPAAIFACDLQAGPCAGPGAHAPAQIATNSIFVNVSTDGSNAFFTSKEALTGTEVSENGETAVVGERNLYAWDGQTETTRFIAILDPQDFASFAGIPGMNLARWTTAINPGPQIGRALSPTRSTPDGEVFVFQSHAQLTAYENEGVGEIYRYDPAAEPGERLSCASCDPSGAPASADALLQDTHAGTGVNENTLIANVTDGGAEVFFQSADRLLPEDANGVQDVYEWKAKGSASCKRHGGCLGLISSGQGEHGNFLYGMSGDGHDVFFRTLEKLVGADVPGSPSFYDARVEGGIPDPPVEAPCQGDACQGEGSTPPALPVPASTASGDGNEEPKANSCSKGRHLVKGRCVKKHHRRAHHHKRAQQRANHNRRAGK